MKELIEDFKKNVIIGWNEMGMKYVLYFCLVAYTGCSLITGMIQGYSKECSAKTVPSYLNVAYHAGCLVMRPLPDLYGNKK